MRDGATETNLPRDRQCVDGRCGRGLRIGNNECRNKIDDSLEFCNALVAFKITAARICLTSVFGGTHDSAGSPMLEVLYENDLNEIHAVEHGV